MYNTFIICHVNRMEACTMRAIWLFFKCFRQITCPVPCLLAGQYHHLLTVLWYHQWVCPHPQWKESSYMTVDSENSRGKEPQPKCLRLWWYLNRQHETESLKWWQNFLVKLNKRIYCSVLCAITRHSRFKLIKQALY